MERIINSILDTDLYKLTMGQAVFHHFPDVKAEFQLINRGGTKFPEGFARKMQDQIEMMHDLSLNGCQRSFLEETGLFATDYLDWLSDYRFDPDEISLSQKGGDVYLGYGGFWKRVILWETTLMPIMTEMFPKERGQLPDPKWKVWSREKAETLKDAGAKYSDFGTRRRFSFDIHDQMVQIQKVFGGENFIGTSNVELAMKHNLRPIGTFAHEWVMGMAGIYGVEEANKKAMEIWAKEYDGKLSTALTDTFTTEVFLRSFTREKAAIFKTLRQDSGNPRAWTDLVVRHIQENLGLDPQDFTALYSDALNTNKVLDILDFTRGRINSLFGIGTYLSNDVGVKPLNIVIKMFSVTKPDVSTRIPVVKLSDEPGKISGDKSVVEEYMRRLDLRLAA